VFKKPPPQQQTPAPTKEQLLSQQNWALKSENEHLKQRLSFYNDSVRSIVLRLKVWDMEEMKKDIGEDGTIPMRMVWKELMSLIMAYDDKLPAYDISYSPSPTSAYSRRRRP